MKRRLHAPHSALLPLILLVAALAACSKDSRSNPEFGGEPELPNILFIVIDDLGVDQLPVFGYGGETPAATPNIDAVARAGVRFRNTWSMPTCSPSRASAFVGRYPSRTQVLNAVVSLDLANSQVSPHELTTPQLLRERGYVSGLVGKMHLTGSNIAPENNPLGDGAMQALGWDHFEGYLDGAPYPIDVTAGGVGDVSGGTYQCGFVPNADDDPEFGADSGACYLADDSCGVLTTDDARTPGRACLERGGLFDPGASCQVSPPAHLDFERQNGYYTGEWVLNHADGNVVTQPVSHPRSRGYRSTLETDRAVDWLRQQTPYTPWMLSVGYSAIHTPLQQPPTSLLPARSIETGGFECTDLGKLGEQRVLTNQMLEALDHEIGRLLVEGGIADRRDDGSLDYRPERSNTVIVIVADNGTYGPSVKFPFDLTRAKGFPYQTGVWVPLIVAGPVVAQPDRDVPHMVNVTDLYALFAELAGVDLDGAVPAARVIDAEPVLPYLLDPGHAAIREVNFTEMGTNITSTEVDDAPPCAIPAYGVCVQIFPQAEVCLDQGGIWYGPDGAAGADGLSSCCEVNDHLATMDEAPYDVMPWSQKAIRNEHYKLVRIERPSCATGELESSDELYRISEAVPIPRLDRAGNDELQLGHGLLPHVAENYQALKDALTTLEARNDDCPGDGNRDGVVDALDLDEWEYFSTHNSGRSSWYDFNHDGVTDAADRAIIEANLGPCPGGR